MKATLRIPTKEQYAFIEIESEIESAEEAVIAYREINNLIQGGTGLVDKDFNRVIDQYLTEEKIITEDYLAMSVEQKKIIQEIKKSFKRIKSKQ